MSLAIFFAVLTSVMLAILPLSSAFGPNAEPVLSVILAGMFWLSLILEQVFFWSANKTRKKIQRKAFRGRRLVRPSLGVITFCANAEARIVDIILLPSVVLVVLLIVFGKQLNWFITLALGLCVLAFTLHCMFNGTTYRYIKAFQKIKKEPKRNEKA